MKYVSLNFPDIFLDRLDDYARKHRLKRNAVVMLAFELLEDRKEPVQPRKGESDESW